MALGATARGTVANTSLVTSAAITPSANFSSGSLAVFFLSVDNQVSGGGADGALAISDTKGNTWTRRISNVITSGTALDGQEAAVWETSMGAGLLTTSDTITVTWTNNARGKAAALFEVSGGAAYSNSGSSTASASTAPSITSASLASGDLIFGAVFVENGAGLTFTDDTDTTNGSWSTSTKAQSGTGNSNSSLLVQSKVVSGAGTQTFNPTLSIGSDLCIAWVSFTPSGGGITVKTLAALGVG